MARFARKLRIEFPCRRGLPGAVFYALLNLLVESLWELKASGKRLTFSASRRSSSATKCGMSGRHVQASV